MTAAGRDADTAGQPDEGPEPGPLGFLELTVLVMRDRSHASWMFLGDEELLRAVHARRAVAAYLPGELLANPDLVLLRLAVSPEGLVAVVDDDGRPVPGPTPVEEFLPGLLDELRTVALIPPDQIVAPPWLPADEIVSAARTPTRDSRVVYCFRATDTVVARSFASVLQAPLTVVREDGWVIAATPHGPATVLTGPPPRISGAYPFAVLDRRGQERTFGYAESAKDSSLHVSVEWAPPLRPAVPDGSGPASEELALWLSSPREWAAGASARGRDDLPPLDPPRPDGMSAAQDAMITRWLDERDDATGFLADMAAGFDLPALAARLAESGPDDPEPEGAVRIEPSGKLAMIGAAMAEQDTEPEGRMPWTVLERALWRRPTVGVVLGLLELLVAVVVAVVVVSQGASAWWWVLVAVFLVGGLAHGLAGWSRLRSRRHNGPAEETAPPG